MRWEKPRGGIWKTDKNAKAKLVENTVGRFPSNIIYEDNENVKKALMQSIDKLMNIKDKEYITRIFYCAKVKGKNKDDDQNIHPTIKPISLMRYLCKLVKSPLNCTILDPFMGSGSTGIACILENIKFIGIEKESTYFEIAKKRLTNQTEITENQLTNQEEPRKTPPKKLEESNKKFSEEAKKELFGEKT
jgi:DNA modification methylase